MNHQSTQKTIRSDDGSDVSPDEVPEPMPPKDGGALATIEVPAPSVEHLVIGEGRRVKDSVVRALSWATATHRSGWSNQDAIGADGMCFTASDGMGGRQEGGACSVETVTAIHRAHPTSIEELERAVFLANVAVWRRVAHLGGGCTIAAVVVMPSGLAALGVGDSRVYTVSAGQLYRHTVDDNQAAYHDPARRGDHSAQSILTQFVGRGPTLERHAVRIEVPATGIRVALLTDGVHTAVNDKAIGEIIGATERTPEDAARDLVNAAVTVGTTDDASAVVIDIGWVSTGALAGVQEDPA
jgi:serine/threonine protein phosphatase PrpC